MCQIDRDEGRRNDGLATAESEELRRLRRDLLNTDQTPTPMQEYFRTDERSFPRNLKDKAIHDRVFYAVRADEQIIEISDAALSLVPGRGSGRFGGKFGTVERRPTLFRRGKVLST